LRGVAPSHSRTSTLVAVRLTDPELTTLDAEIEAGRAQNRSDAIRSSLRYLARRQRYAEEATILAELAERGEAVYPDLEGLFERFDYPGLDG